MKEEKIEKIKFGDLNGWLKVAIIGGFLAIVSFVIGFISGFLFS